MLSGRGASYDQALCDRGGSTAGGFALRRPGPGTSVCAGVGPAVARSGRPTVSPYANMVFADGLGQLGVGGGYQTLVRPFVDGRRAINANSAAISRLESQAASGYAGGGGDRQSCGSLHELFSLLPSNASRRVADAADTIALRSAGDPISTLDLTSYAHSREHVDPCPLCDFCPAHRNPLISPAGC